MLELIMATLASIAYVVLVVVTRKEGRIVKLTVWLYGPMVAGLVAVAIFISK